MKVLRWERDCGVGWAARALETLGGEQERGWRREGALKGSLVILVTFPRALMKITAVNYVENISHPGL